MFWVGYCENLQGKLLFFNRFNFSPISKSGASKRHYSQCVELPPLGVFCLNLETEEIRLNPWQTLNNTHLEQLSELQDILGMKIEIKSTIQSLWLVKDLSNDDLHCFNFEVILNDYVKEPSNQIFQRLLENENILSVCDEVISRLENSLSDRILATPSVCRECLQSESKKCIHVRIGILFSGGIDCTILAVLMDKLLDAAQPIDLINVSFEKINRSNSKTAIDYNTPDRISAKESLEELKMRNPKR